MAVSASSVTYRTDLSALSDADLTSATNRAWRDAARCWAEYRREPAASPAKAMLLTSADAAETWWEHLRDEADLRDGVELQGAEVRSDDLYEVVSPVTYPLADGGVTAIPPTRPKYEPVVSPWARRAARHELPFRIEGGATRDQRVAP